MFNRGLLIIPAFLIGISGASAQDINEAYNLSNLTTQGTARSMGFGNALGSVGADFSTLSVNPAGIGIYRSSEFTFTPSLRMNSASSQYLGTTTLDNNTRFNINNFGMVFTNAPKGQRYERRNWKTVSFAFGMNRVADFNRNYTYSGNNTNNSMTQAFVSDANQYDVSTTNTPGYIGYKSSLINPDGSGGYYSIVPISGGIMQQKSTQERGRINEYTLSVGGNYKEKLMLGATLGIPDFEYQSNSTYQESLAPGNTAANPGHFNWFSYNQSLALSGSGINLKLGAIYKLTDFLRVGAAFHSPTIYSITDIYTPSVTSVVNNVQTDLNIDNGLLLQNRFDYSFTSSWKGLLSATFILKNIGFITADYEYVDYSTMRYIYPTGVDDNGLSYKTYEDAMNQSIRNTYQAASNFRIGAEALVTRYFMARAGFGYYGNPYKASGVNAQRIDLSLGLGFHFHHFFTDLALVHSAYQGQMQPYTIDFSGVPGPASIVPTATTDFALNNLAWTVGMKF